MNDREKRLFLFLAVIVVGIGALFGYKSYANYRANIHTQMEAAKLTLNNAEDFLVLREQAAEQLAFLERSEPEPRAIQDVKPAVMQFATKRAEDLGLTVLSPGFLDAEQGERHYARVRVRMTVTGTEEAFYRWLHEVQSPNDFRTVFSIDMITMRDDNTKIYCVVVLEQWFVPEPSPS